MIKLGGTKKKVIQLWEDFLSGGRFFNYFFWFRSDAGVDILARLVPRWDQEAGEVIQLSAVGTFYLEADFAAKQRGLTVWYDKV